MSGYADFLAAKTRVAPTLGRPCEPAEVHPMLHPWQARIVAWAVRKGRAAVWADTGLGKSFVQLEWARLSGRRALVLAPLAVCQQTVREAARLGIEAHYRREDGGESGITVTNYEMADRFDPSGLDAVVLDEASILKQSDGKTRTRLIRQFANVPARLACTATPAPNDPEELTSQAEFLGVMSRVEMLASYFIHDDEGWRVKGHARGPMMRWMASWAVALRRPSDLGYPDAGYLLPGLDIRTHLVDVEPLADEGQLFATTVQLGGVGGRAKVRRATLAARCRAAAGLVVGEWDEPWVLWCGLNDEARMLAGLIEGSVNVEGSWSPEDKAAAFADFADGKTRALITKPSMSGYGLNWQHAARMVFVGLGDSFEQYYQCIRRCYRYGQTRPVVAHVVLSNAEKAIAENIARKEREASNRTDQLVAEMARAAEWRDAR
jgi:superfamily II DNA or RNA helicase